MEKMKLNSIYSPIPTKGYFATIEVSQVTQLCGVKFHVLQQ